MPFGGLGINIPKLSKRTILTTIAGIAQNMLEDKTPENEMAKTISKKVMRDPQIEFLLKSLTNRFNLWGADIKVAPQIEESSLKVETWNLVVDNKIALSANGLEELTRQITEYVLTTDEAKIQELVDKLEDCIR
jgi:hypothetical protein